MEKTKKVANLAGISATIMDDTLYQLSDVEQQFGIAQIELMQRASQPEMPLIKLCFSPPVDTVIHVVDTAFICINGFNYRNRDPALPAFDKKVDIPQIFHDHQFIAMILSPDSCENLRRTSTVEQSLFMEAYAISIDFNKKPIDGSINVVRPKMTYTQNHDKNRVDSNRLRFAAYPRLVEWKFSELNGFQPPRNITISRNDLCIYGTELKRFMDEVEEKISTSGVQNHETKADTHVEAQVSLKMLEEDVEEKIATSVVQNYENKKDAHAKAQALFVTIAALVIERAEQKNIKPPLDGSWPGRNEDIFAFAKAWAKAHEHTELERSTLQLIKYKRGIIACTGLKSESDYYLNLFPEYKEKIIGYRKEFEKEREKAQSKKRDANGTKV